MTKMLKSASQDASDQVTAPASTLSVTQSSAGSSLQAFARAKPRHAHQSLQRNVPSAEYLAMKASLVPTRVSVVLPKVRVVLVK